MQLNQNVLDLYKKNHINTIKRNLASNKKI